MTKWKKKKITQTDNHRDLNAQAHVCVYVYVAVNMRSFFPFVKIHQRAQQVLRSIRGWWRCELFSPAQIPRICGGHVFGSCPGKSSRPGLRLRSALHS